MRDYSLRRFIAIALISVILLSIVWNSVGKSYNALVVHTLSPFLPAGAQVQAQGNLIRMTARRAAPSVMVKVVQDGREIAVGRANIYFSTPSAQDAWPMKNAGASPTTYFQDLEGRVLYYALIPTVALMLAVPAITFRLRSLCLAAVLSVAFFAHLVGLYLIAQRFVWWVNNVLDPTDPGRVGILSPFYVFMAVSPLLVLIPIIYFRWRSGLSPASG